MTQCAYYFENAEAFKAVKEELILLYGNPHYSSEEGTLAEFPDTIRGATTSGVAVAGKNADNVQYLQWMTMDESKELPVLIDLSLTEVKENPCVLRYTLLVEE